MHLFIKTSTKTAFSVLLCAACVQRGRTRVGMLLVALQYNINHLLFDSDIICLTFFNLSCFHNAYQNRDRIPTGKDTHLRETESLTNIGLHVFAIDLHSKYCREFDVRLCLHYKSTQMFVCNMNPLCCDSLLVSR